MLISFATAENQYEWLKYWGNNSMATYIKLRKGTDVAELAKKFPEFVLKYVEPEDES
ncbi:MAG: hypothetical protein R2759_05055 [Bacteroidales bacterium]